MTVKHLYPNSTPALNLNFKSSRVADPRISCTRLGVATYVDPVSGLIKTAAENKPRVDKHGLLVESSRTNHIEYSVDLTNAQWYKYYVTPSLNAGTAPDGTNTAVKLVPNAATVNRSLLDTGVNATFSSWLTVSVYAKAAEYYKFALSIDGASAGGAFNGGAIFDVSAGTVTQGTNGTGRIEALANGWYRCSVSHTNTAQSFTVWPGINMYDNSGNSWFTANGTDGCLFWGFQLEVAEYASSYIPTNGSTVTRNTDINSLSGNNYTSWFHENQGTFVLDQANYESYSTDYLMYINEPNASNYHIVRNNTNAYTYVMLRAGSSSNQSTLEWAPQIANQSYRLAYSWSSTATKGAAKGDLATSYSEGNVPTGMTNNILGLGGYANTSIRDMDLMNVANLSYYLQPFTTDELKTITK